MAQSAPESQNPGLLDHPVSVFLRVQAQVPLGSAPLAEVLRQVRDGTYALDIATLRASKPHLTDKDYKAEKAKLKCFTPCCTLRTRDQKVSLGDKLLTCSGLVHLDFDHLTDPVATKAQLVQEPSLVFCFVSTSGDGLKTGFAATGIVDGDTYKHAWHHTVQLLEARYPGLAASRDNSVSYINALCYVSHDPDLFMNEQAVPMAVTPYVTPAPVPEPLSKNQGASFAVVASALPYIPNQDTHYDVWFKLGAALHSTGQPWARGLFDSWSQQSPKFDPRKQTTTWRSLRHDGTVQIDWLLGQARKAGWRDPEEDEGIKLVFSPEKIDPGDPHETSSKPLTSLNSLNSYPWPVLAEEALYGLAGEYVGTIAPHSEADPAALLMQFLAVFGVVVGRNRFFVVEDTQHYPNLFTVVVGQTSRARKGTSFDRILKRFEPVDPTWSRANLIKGCGSGEGLIHAVRDARWGKEAIKEKGRVVEYQDILLDPGVDDKRGLYQTSEFSSIMAIAAREGSNLSETLRECWETGYLRNTVKTNPMTATGAHIGLIGHITLGEVRRVISTAELGNGFANRFLWICAKRSQLLPDGGALPAAAFVDLVPRLKRAVATGQQAGPMQRDDAARAAWHAVYKPLAKETNPLADTVLARSEAQVLRLSMLYALLDASAVIRHEHVNAALACWQYAEDSAALIFGSLTGDRTADAILQALRDAGEEGLTKTALLEDVFGRNVPSLEVTRALVLLEQARRIVPKTRPAKGGRGRPSTAYTIMEYEFNEFNEVNQRTYLSISNDAVKAAGIFSDPVRGKYEVNPPNGAEPPLDPPFVPDMTGVPPDGIPFTIPENGYKTEAEPPMREPGDDTDLELDKDDDEEGDLA